MSNPPPIGHQWPEQGGFYAGVIRDTKTNKQWHLVMAASAIEGIWGNYGNEIPGEFSFTDGQANTALIRAAEPENELLKAIDELDCGHTDFYLPAQKELNLLYINLQDLCEERAHWSSTQYSALSAWSQYFVVGYQGFNLKDDRFAARAVRRLPIE